MKTPTKSENESKRPSGATSRAEFGITAPAAPRSTHLEVKGIHAQSVYVAGTFNEWKPTATPLKPVAPDCWATELKLRPGRHEYLLVADGKWLPDPLCAHLVTNPFGGVNCVLEV